MGRGLSLQQKTILVDIYDEWKRLGPTYQEEWKKGRTRSFSVDSYQVGNEMGRKREKKFDSTGERIWEKTPTGRTSFAFTTNVLRASVSRSVLRLEERGLITCSRREINDYSNPDPERGHLDEHGKMRTKEIRCNYVQFTDAGIEYVESLIEKGEAKWETKYDSWKKKEYRVLVLSVNPKPLAEDEV